MTIHHTSLTDEEYVRSLYTSRQCSRVIDELCTRLEKAIDNSLPDYTSEENEGDSEEVKCPFCEGTFTPREG